MIYELNTLQIVIFLTLSGIVLRSTLSIVGQNWIRSYHFLGTFILLPNIAYVITTVIAGDIALSLGMIGALSIVRFRHPVRSNFELTMYFALLTLGIAAGVNAQLAFLLLAIVFITIIGIEFFQYLGKFLNFKIFQLSFNEGISNNILDFIVVLFTQEFGVFWFSPIIFFGLLFSILFFIKEKKISFFLFATFSFYFLIINAWQSTGNAYGFRYVYPLITLSVLLYLYLIKYIGKYKNISDIYLLIFSIFSILSVLFFEGWTGTQLSLEVIENSFGKYEKFVQPDYLSGFFKGFLEINAYLKIFTTSFLGMFIFKVFVSLFGIDGLNNILDSYGLPVNNLDFQEYLIQVNEISIISIFSIILFCILLARKILKYLVQN